MSDTSHQNPAPPTVEEIADLTARLRALSAAGRNADPDARSAFLDDKHALLARITDTQDRYPDPDPRNIPVSRAEAAEQLVALGHEPARARQIVTEYLDDTSHRIGVPVHQWGLDQGDVAAMAQQHHDVGVPGPRVSVEEQERRNQLNRWHTDDGMTSATSSGDEDGWAAR